MIEPNFEWDEAKNLENQRKHGVSFFEAQYSFLEEKRYFCFGMNQDRTGILTVRFTYRKGRVRIFGAGYWRKGKNTYEQSNSI